MTEITFFDGLEVRQEGGLRTVVIDNQGRKNAIKLAMFQKIKEELNEASGEGKTEIVYITGAGDDYFSSGNDLGNYMLVEGDPMPLLQKASKIFEDCVSAFIDFPKLMVVGVNGHAVGWAVTLLGLADVIYASDKATFLTPFSKLGLTAEGCSTYTFPRMMGRSKAMEMLCLDRKINAAEAVDRNLVTDILPHSRFRESVDLKLRQILQLPSGSYNLTKKISREWDKEVLHRVNVRESEALAKRLLSSDSLEAIVNFMASKSKI